jgi:glycosyltransferase involved in cell wall biosynthesis
MKIGIVSQFFPPEAAPLVWSLAEGLADRGHEVSVLTGFPNYPDGEIYAGYQQRWSHLERRGPVLVRRAPLYPSHDDNAVRRAANYISFAATSAAISGFLADCDVIYVYATPMSAAAAAAVLRRFRDRPYVLHVQDLWPESVTSADMLDERLNRLVAAVLRPGLAYLYRNASHIVAIGPTMKQMLKNRGVAPEKVSVIYNWSADEPHQRIPADPQLRTRLGRPDRTLAVYAGNIGRMQDIDTIVRAAALCRNAPLDVAIMGSGTETERIRQLALDMGTDNLRVVGPVPESRMSAVYASSDYQLVTLKDRPVFRATIPSKVGTSLAHGCPIITTVPGDVAAMCDRGKFGFSCVPEDPAALAHLLRLASNTSAVEWKRMSDAAREFYKSNMSIDTSLSAVEAVLDSISGMEEVS